MTIDLINYNNNSGLIYVDISDGINNFNNLSLFTNYISADSIFCIINNNILYNKCNESGLYFIIDKLTMENNKSIAILLKINNDDSELIANIDCDNNYKTTDSCEHKLYKAGKLNSKCFYYCYECGNYLWK